MKETLATIETPRGAAEPLSGSLVLWDDKVVETSLSVRFMKRWSRERVRRHCAEHGWRVTVIQTSERPKPW